MYVTVIKWVKCDICIIATKKTLCNIIKGEMIALNFSEDSSTVTEIVS